VGVREWLSAASRIVPASSAQLVRTRSLELLPQVQWLRAELGRPRPRSAEVTLSSEDGADRRTLRLDVAWEPLPARRSGPTGHRVLPGGVGYLRIASMDDDPSFLRQVQSALLDLRDTRGLVLDVRGNGGGSRDALEAIFPCFMRETDPPRIVNVAAHRLPPDERPERPDGHLEDRHLYPLTWSGGPAEVRPALAAFASTFAPAWTPPAGELTSWHFMALRREPGTPLPTYEKPVVVLTDSRCFSATDIFLGAMKGWRNVTLMGTPSGGGSGRARPLELAHSGLELALSSMASFRADGSLYDGVGIQPDVLVEPTLDDLRGRTDSLLEAALARLAAPASGQ
jgi:C-terminal processing protease CtpA/Prc